MNATFTIGYMIIPLIIAAIIGFVLGWLIFRGKTQDGDLSVEGESALRAEADKLRTENQALQGRLTTHETEVSNLKSKLASAGAGAVTGAAAADAATTEASDEDETYALEWRNRYLAARVKYLEGRLAESPKAKTSKAKAKKSTASKSKAAPKKTAPKKTAPKKSVAKKPAAKKASAKKAPAKSAAPKAKAASAANTKRKPGPKPGTKRGELTAAGKPRKKPGPKPGSTRSAKPKVSKEEAAFEKYYTNVKKYDSKAKRKTVENIVKYCGVALRSRDSSLVACSDESELKRVADGFVTKKLGKTSGQMELVQDVCKEMKSDRFKSRVTFYYLTAKKARKMSLFN
jgi:hypothetical protein